MPTVETVFRFEVEHGFQQALFGANTPLTIRQALQAAGIRKDMMGNLAGMYNRDETVYEIRNLSGQQ